MQYGIPWRNGADSSGAVESRTGQSRPGSGQSAFAGGILLFRDGTPYFSVMGLQPLRRVWNLPGGEQFAERRAHSARARNPSSEVRRVDQSTAAGRKRGASFLQRFLEDDLTASRLLASRYLKELQTRPGEATEVVRMLNRFALVLCLLSLARLDRCGIEALRNSSRSPGGASKGWLKVLAKLQGHLRRLPLVVMADNLFDNDHETVRWFFAESRAIRVMTIVFALLVEDAGEARDWSPVLMSADERSMNAIRFTLRRSSRQSAGAAINFSAILAAARRSLAAALREAAAVREEVSDALAADEIGGTNDGYERAEARAELLKLTERLQAVSRPTDLGVELLRQAAALDDPTTANLIRLVQVSVRPGVGEAAAKKFIQRTFERVRQLVRRENQRRSGASSRVAVKKSCPDPAPSPHTMQVR